MDINRASVFLQIILIILLVFVRYGFEKLLALSFKKIHLVRLSLQLFTRAWFLIFFNLIVLVIFGLLRAELFSLREPRIGLIILAVGLGIAILVAVMSLLAIKAGFGSGYGTMAPESGIDKGLMLVTFFLLAGASEDIFFIGFAQNSLTPTLGWAAIVAYLVIFVAYHYANVLSGVESKKEFLGTLPVRFLVACLLGISFYLTRTLVWGMVVHNLVDTLSYCVLILASASKPAARSA